MSADQPIRLAKRSKYLRSNIIRDMLRVANQPGMIALGGGNPAIESFPLALMPQLMTDVMRNHAAVALQYCDTQGYPPLREALATWLAGQGIPATNDNVIITTGSQNALDLIAKLLIDNGSQVIGEQPTYLGALQAFSLFAPRWYFLNEDSDGPTPDSLHTLLRQRPETSPLLYIMPAFRNPTGSTWSSARIAALAAILERSNNWIVEDDPYRLLSYNEPPPPPLKTRLPGHTIYVGTLSKVFAPGLRLGYCVAPDALVPWLVKIKQGTDLNTGTLSQALAAEYITSGRLDAQLPEVVRIYRDKRDILADALYRYLPETFKFQLPSGGMFLWVKGPPGFDSSRFLETAIRHGVFFVPGSAFFDDAVSEDVQRRNRQCMRLNFSGNNTSNLKEAARRLGAALNEFRRA